MILEYLCDKANVMIRVFIKLFAVDRCDAFQWEPIAASVSINRDGRNFVVKTCRAAP